MYKTKRRADAKMSDSTRETKRKKVSVVGLWCRLQVMLYTCAPPCDGDIFLRLRFRRALQPDGPPEIDSVQSSRNPLPRERAAFSVQRKPLSDH